MKATYFLATTLLTTAACFGQGGGYNNHDQRLRDIESQLEQIEDNQYLQQAEARERREKAEQKRLLGLRLDSDLQKLLATHYNSIVTDKTLSHRAKQKLALDLRLSVAKEQDQRNSLR